MASIIKRKSKYSVAYWLTDENGERRQKWESFDTHAQAKKRKAEVEHQLAAGTFIAPSATTLAHLLEEYVSIYGANTWAPSTYEGHRGLIDNYILPLLGDTKLDDITPRMMDRFYQRLQTMRAKQRPYETGEAKFISAHTIREIHKILRSAFNQAVKWELMARNPVQNATLPKYEKKERENLNSTPFVRQYGILKNEWGDLLCPKGFRTRNTHQSSRNWWWKRCRKKSSVIVKRQRDLESGTSGYKTGNESI